MIGTGVLKGMAVTARNFLGSYFEKDRLITVQYPEERETLPENYRNFPFLVFDNDPEAGLRCVAIPNTITAGLDLTRADVLLGSLSEVTLAQLLTRVEPQKTADGTL